MIVLEPIIYGILWGGVLSLTGIGFTLVYGVLDVVNLSHGVFVMLGAYTSYWLVTLYGIDVYATIPITFAVLFILGYLYQRFVVQRVIGERQLLVFVLTFGTSILVESLVNYFWTPDVRSITPYFAGKSLMIGSMTIPWLRMIAFLFSIVVTFFFFVILRYTQAGKAIRATGDDRFTAILLGIDLPKVYSMTMALSAGIAGVAGTIILTLEPITPYMDLYWTLYSFIVVVIGGLGSVIGALVGGLVLGMILSLAGWYWSQGISVAVAFALLTLLLFIRPTGILGREHMIRH